MIGKDLNAAADQQGEEQEIDVVSKAQPERETEECIVVTHGVEAVALVCPVFLTGCARERLADGFFGVLRETSAGYVIVVPRTLAKGVSV